MGWQLRDQMWEWSSSSRIKAWVTTRQGGVGSPPFDTLNISTAVNDREEAVKENRRRALAFARRSPKDLVTADQVHHNRVAWVFEQDRGTVVAAADGLLTMSSKVVLGMGFADCVPIFLTDVNGRVGGVLHAGWRGTVRGVQTAAVKLLAAMGIAPRDLLVGIGPSIGPCCYEVDYPVEVLVRSTAGDLPLSPARREGHWMLDLWQANALLLARAGVLPEHIDQANLCTSCHPQWFFSHRRDKGRTGRLGGYICLTP